MSKILICGILLSAIVLAQPNIVGAGHTVPVPFSVAPGEIVTIFAEGVGKSPTVTMRQITGKPLPVLQVRPAANGTPAAITVQIPYDAIPLCLFECFAFFPATLFVSDGGRDGPAVEVSILPDHIHVLTTCDLLFVEPARIPPVNASGLPCPHMVTHADGSMVNVSNPAKSGETLVAYAFGLGQTDPAGVTGQPASKAAPTVTAYNVDYNFRPNARPTRPRPSTAPVFAGLATKYIGLYQINFLVPEIPLGTFACETPPTVPVGANVIQSNLTVSFGGATSFDGAGVCVTPRLN